MGVTISTHNGSSAHRDHNIRNIKVVSKEDHIDLNRTHENWIDEEPKKAYDRIFGNSVKAYNDKQTRSDRVIKDYYKSICEDKKKHPVYEMIIGVYGKDENGAVICDEATGKQIMKEFVQHWRTRNPNLEIIGAYYHADEDGEPHCHIDYIPVAHGYTRGMETQTGLVKALGEMGFQKQGKATAQIQWEARENEALDNICRSYGLEVDHPKEQGRKHIDTELYKAQESLKTALDDTKDLLDQKDDLQADISDLQAKRDNIAELNDKANEQLYRRQEQLHRMAIVKKPGLFNKGEDVVYNKNMIETIQDNISTARDDRKYADSKMREVAEREQRVKSQEEHTRPLYDRATAEYNRCKELRKNEEAEILKKAKELVRDELSKVVKTPEVERMRNFMSKLKNNKGQTMLEMYDEAAKRADDAKLDELYNKIVSKQRSRSRSRDYDDLEL